MLFLSLTLIVFIIHNRSRICNSQIHNSKSYIIVNRLAISHVVLDELSNGFERELSNPDESLLKSRSYQLLA